MKLLFVCTANMLRSPTAEKLFATRPGVETRSAGTLKAMSNPCREVSDDDVAWADIIFCMERHHAEALEKRFPRALDREGRDQVIVVLNISDDYERDDPALIRLLRHKVEPFLVDAG